MAMRRYATLSNKYITAGEETFYVLNGRCGTPQNCRKSCTGVTDAVFIKGDKMIAINDEELNEVRGGTKIPYIVQTGDTLGELAKKFHCTVEEVCKWNDIKDPNKIDAGQLLIFKF